jgi:hypothetical protein
VASNAGHVLGIRGELATIDDLIARGFRVYSAVGGYLHPDLVALDNAGRALSVECRVVTATKGAHGGGKWKRRKRSDQCNHYAWISPDLSQVEYEPALPEVN